MRFCLNWLNFRVGPVFILCGLDCFVDCRFNFKLIQRQFQRAKKLQSEIEVLGMQVAAATQNMGFYAAQMNDRQQRRQRKFIHPRHERVRATTAALVATDFVHFFSVLRRPFTEAGYHRQLEAWRAQLAEKITSLSSCCWTVLILIKSGHIEGSWNVIQAGCTGT